MKVKFTLHLYRFVLTANHRPGPFPTPFSTSTTLVEAPKISNLNYFHNPYLLPCIPLTLPPSKFTFHTANQIIFLKNSMKPIINPLKIL